MTETGAAAYEKLIDLLHDLVDLGVIKDINSVTEMLDKIVVEEY